MPLSTANWHLPSTSRIKSCAAVAADFQHLLREVQGGEQKWGPLCPGKTWEDRSSDRDSQEPILWAQILYLSIPTRGEGTGNPLWYSCLENPVDRGAWWASVLRVAQSWTWLKQLSMHACIGEGNGNLLQCSYLENPRGGGACWAAISGATQSRTQLKLLTSSSSSIPTKALNPSWWPLFLVTRKASWD